MYGKKWGVILLQVQLIFLSFEKPWFVFQHYYTRSILFSVNFLTLNKLKSLFFLHLITDFALKVNSLLDYQIWSTQIIVHEKFSPFLTMKNIFVFISCYSEWFFHNIYLYLKKLFWKLLICFKKSGHEDGRGIGQGDHFLSHKLFKRTFECWVNSTKQLLNAGRGHQTPRKVAHCLRKEVGQNIKDKKRDKRGRDGDPSWERSLKREVSKHQETLSPLVLWGILESQRTT